MIKVYGSLKCPYCVVLKENLDRNKIEYDFIDILASLSNLGAFLSLRDKDPVFDRLKEIEDIGVPALIDESGDRKSTRLNSSHPTTSRMPSSA